MIHKLILIISFTLLAGVNSLPAKAQSISDRAEIAGTIYLLDVRPKLENPSSAVIELNEFAQKMLALRLASLKSFAVITQKGVPTCIGPGVTGSTTFYVFKTSIDSTPSTIANQQNTEMILDYELLKYVGCQVTSLVHRSEAFKEQTALSGLITMSDVMALLLEEERNAKRSILNVAVGVSMPGYQPIKDKTVDYLVSRLTQIDDFTTIDLRNQKQSETPDYTITPRFTPRQGDAWLHYTVDLRDGRSFKSRAESVPKGASPEQLAKFYEDAATLGISFMQDVKYAMAAGLSGPISIEQAAAMEKRAFELMCYQQNEKNCNYQPESAVPLLTELTGKMKASNSKVAYQLLADAYLSLEEYADAASALDQVISLTGSDSIDVKLNLLQKSASSWYESKHYVEAAARAEEFIKLSNLSTSTVTLDDMILKRSKSYYFLGDYPKALSMLLENVGHLSKVGRSEGTQVRQLSESVIEYLHGKELEKAVAQLKQSAEKESYWWPLKGAWFTAENRLARERLVSAESAYANGDFATMNALLTSNESIPVENLGYATRGEILRLRALWHRDAKQDLAGALQLLSRAWQLDISDQEIRTKIRLHYAETRLINKDYEAATALLAEFQDPDPEFAGYAPVRLFYLFWAHLALNNETQANEVEAQWNNSMKQLQKTAKSVPWVFTAAQKALRDFTLAPDRKQKLLVMLDNMRSAKRPASG